MRKMLKVEDLNTYYDEIRVLKEINLSLQPGTMVSVIGANGAGKSTLLNAISGLISRKRGRINFQGREISHFPPERIVELGICQVPEGRRIFGTMTVYENLELGGYIHSHRKTRKEMVDRIESIYNLFPVLRERKKQSAGSLSGGEQQMLAIGRALMGKPSLLLLDEPSTGLAPLVVKEVFRIIKGMRTAGITILLVEQNAKLALKNSNYGYILNNGKIVLEGEGLRLLQGEQVVSAYLGRE
jgi:branched-chain amino acid transport system ATP-binding protein